MTISQIDIGLILGYIVIVLALGFLSARKQSPDEFLTHGRSLNLFQFITTVSASFIGGGAIVAYGAYVFEFGIVAFSLYIALFFSMIAFSRFAPKLRQEGHAHDHMTLADYFYIHVGPRAGMTSSLVLFAVFFLFIVNQFIAGSYVLASISGWSYEASLVICAAVVLAYLLLGGLKSVVKTDIFQYLSMIVLIVALGSVSVAHTGINPQLLDLKAMSPTLLLAFILYGLFIPFVSAEIWQRIYATRNDQTARWGLIGAGACILILGLAITLLGLAARTAFPSIDPAQAIPYGMVHLFPAGLLGLGLVFLFAAIMSSTDTLIFYLSTSIAKDYFGRVKNITDKKNLERITRVSLIAITVLTVLSAFIFRNLIEVIITVAGVSSSLFFPVVASFFMKLKENAVIAALIASCIYIVILIAAGLIVPDYAMASVLISGGVLWGWQKFGK